MDRIARSPLVACAFLILLSFCTIFFRLGSLPLIGADEPRYARIAQEMLQDHRWVTPTLEFRPWLEKPPLYYWITVPLYAVFGMTETSARLGPASLGLISALAVFRLGTRFWSPAAGLMSASILLTAVGYVAFARGASTDMPLTACLTVALALLAEAAVARDLPGWRVLPAYLLLGLSVLAKGPVAVVLVAGILLLFWLFDERGGGFRRWHALSGLIITTAVSLPWFWLAFRENGFAFVSTFFINHNIARFVSDIHHHSEPFYYYVPVLLGLFIPWSAWLLLLWPSSIAGELRRWRDWDRATLFLLCWIVFPLVFFSFSESKLAGYALPALPPLALLLGSGWSKATAGGVRHRIRLSAAWLYLLLSAGLAVASPLVFGTEYGGAWRIGFLVSTAVFLPALFAFFHGIRGRWRLAFAATLVQGLALVLAIAQFAFPVIGTYESTREIARQALAQEKPGEPIVTFLSFHHALYYYTGYRISADFEDLDSLMRFAAAHRNLLVVVRAEHVDDLERLPGFKVKVLGSQGNLRLLELGKTVPG